MPFIGVMRWSPAERGGPGILQARARRRHWTAAHPVAPRAPPAPACGARENRRRAGAAANRTCGRMRSLPSVPLSTLLVVAAGACSSTREVSPPIDLAPRAVVERARFEVRHQGRVLGTLVELEIQDRDGPLRFYRIENRDGAWVGHATGQLRFSQRLPFRDDERDLGMWPLPQGVARLFEVDGAVVLRPLPLAAPATARKTP